MSNEIEVLVRNGVCTITLNRPHAMNAVTPAMHLELSEALDRFSADDAQRVCVITGAGERAFCAGSDLRAVQEQGFFTPPSGGYAGIAERFQLMKPIVAAVNGLALGGGFEIALACDIVVATDDASFGLPEPLVGAIAIGGGLHRLPRQVGLKTAMGMILSSAPISAARAFDLGLVNEVVARRDLGACTAKWCKAIMAGAPAATMASKAVVHRSLSSDLETALRDQALAPEFATWRQSDELEEGIAAFVEKRTPSWKG